MAVNCPMVRACSTLSAPSCCVEQALSLCFNGQLYRRADALTADAALRYLAVFLAADHSAFSRDTVEHRRACS